MASDDVEIAGEDTPELRRALDFVMDVITAASDVQGVVLMVFSNDLESPGGTCVSLQARGLLPGHEETARIFKTLLTAKPIRRESS